MTKKARRWVSRCALPLFSFSLSVGSVAQRWRSPGAFSARCSVWLGLYDIQSDVRCHQIKIRIVMDNFKTMLDTECADKDIDCFADSHTF